MISFGEVSKKVGGSLNSVLGIEMMILGAYRFCISNSAYQRLSRNTSYNWVEQNRLGSSPALQYTGKKAETITLEGTIYPQFKGGLRQITLLRAEASFGKALPLISGNGFAFGFWCITDIKENQTYFLQDGTPRKITFNISLKKYGEEKKKGLLGIVQKIGDVL